MRDEGEPGGEGRSPFGQLLREFRIAARLSQETLAERAGLSACGISVLERGTRRAPYRDTVALLASALKLTAEDRTRLQTAAMRAPIPRRRGLGSTHDGQIGGHNLPLSLTSFLGREQERAALEVSLSEQRLVTLTGTGGVGKTRLALETGHAIVERFPDGVWYVELAPLGDPGLVAQRIAATLGIAVPYNGAEPSTAWIAQLIDKRLLIVLDNCEHVLGAAAVVTQQILQRCPNVRVLATSREALRIGGEYVVRVDPLGVPAARAGRLPSLVDLRASPAIRLFLERARLVAPTMKLEDDAAAWQTLGNVCARLDGMPLAIELAAARMNAVTPTVLLRALEGRVQVLTIGARSAPPRHQTLHALIEWSYGLLSEREQRVFRRLAVFSGGWTLESAQTVCVDDDAGTNELLAILSSLIDKSLLVVADPGSSTLRYGMLETTRAYALDRLTAEGERESAGRRHAEYFSDLLRRNNATWGSLPLAAWLVPLEFELDNLRAALGWSLVERHDVALGATIAVAQQTVLESLSLAQEGCHWCQGALSALSPNPPPVLEAPLQLALAKFYVREHYFERAVEAGMRSAAQYRTLTGSSMLRNLSARACLSSALSFIGYALIGLRRNDEGERVASEAVNLARQEPDVAVLAWALIVKSLSGTDIVARQVLLDEALALSQSFPSGYPMEGLALIGFSWLNFDAGDVHSARRFAADAADYFLRSGLHENLACWALAIAATCASLTGDPAGATACARDGLSLARSVGLVSLMNSVQVIASVLTTRGRHSDATRLIGGSEAALARRECPNPPYAQILHDQTITLLRESTSNAEMDVWLAEGRTWRYEESIAAALDFERRSRPSASESYG
jgi:predicted ATPase/DNA-binding XRE family transcriptional regulator